MTSIAVLGSTGSIGANTLDVARRFPEKFRVSALSANSSADVLLSQIKEFRPVSVCVNDEIRADILKKKIKQVVPAFKGKIFGGKQGLLDMIEEGSFDKLVLAISGSAALDPLLKAIDKGRDIAIANKEALVMAGAIIMDKAAARKVRIIPIDSEQSAVWQCLEPENKNRVRNIYLTASGGPFRNLSLAKFGDVSVKDALRHPRWKMGRKITVDCATLMNKGLEVIEAMYLFGISVDKIKIIIHPESIIHSMVEYDDGVILAQLSITDMRIPIQYALSYPKRTASGLGQLDLYKLAQLNFERPDFNRFPCIGLAYQAACGRGTMPAVLNAANEISVEEFLKNKLRFTEIPKVIEKVLNKHKNKTGPSLSDIWEADKWAREEAYSAIRDGIRK